MIINSDAVMSTAPPAGQQREFNVSDLEYPDFHNEK